VLCSVLLFYIQYRTFIRESEEEGRNIFIVMFVPERSERNGKNDELEEMPTTDEELDLIFNQLGL